MPEDPASQAAAPTAGRAAVGWRWMGSGEPLFLRVADQIEGYIKGNGLSPATGCPASGNCANCWE